MVVLVFFFTSANANSQSNSNDSLQQIAKDTTKPVIKDRKLTLSGMVLARYAASLDQNVDVNGKFHPAEGGYSTSSFALRRVRVQAKAQITPKAEAAVLVNLTDFIGNPANKVLELATLKYKFNDYLNLQVGQFRPYFGREDLYPEEMLQTLEWSNQYYAFGANGWQSFQIGATLFGKAALCNMPLKYYVGMFNGNGRNQPMDNDNGKLFPARVELGVQKNTKLGINGGIGKAKGEKVWATNVDIDHIEQLGGAWELEVQSEYKRGTNNCLFDTSAVVSKLMKDYQLAGYYFLPNLKYKLNTGHIQSLELSTRYEHLNCDVKRGGSIKKTVMPMFSCQLDEEYFLRIEFGMIFDKYAHSSTPAIENNASRFICQLQAKF